MPFQEIYNLRTKERTTEHISSDEMMLDLLFMFGNYAFLEDDEVQSQKILQEQLCPVCRQKNGKETPDIYYAKEQRENIDWHQFFQNVADHAECHLMIPASPGLTEVGKRTKADLDKLTGTQKTRLKDGKWVNHNHEVLESINDKNNT